MAGTSLPTLIGQILAAIAEIQAEPFRLLIIGQIGTGSTTAVSGALYEDIESKTNTEIETLFGQVSELTGRILRARAHVKGKFPINVIALDPDGATTSATLDLVVSGTATEDGTIIIKVIDSHLYTISIDVLTDDTAVSVATDIKAEIDGLEKLPVSAGALSVSTIPLTANDGGTIPNKFTVEVVQTVAGITIAAGQFSGGTNDPDITGIFDNVIATRFHAISWPWEGDFTELKTFLENRNIIDNAFLHGVGFMGIDDTEANLSDLVNGTTPLNSPNLIFMGNRKASGNSFFITPPDWRAVEFASIEGLRLTPDVPLGNYLTNPAPLDAFGGSALASLAYYNTPLAYTDIPNPNNLFSQQAQTNLKNDGFTIIGVNESKSSAIMGEVITTYKFDLQGNPNVSFKYLNYVRTAYLILEIYFRTLKRDYSQSRLTEGDIVSNRKMTNAGQIKANCVNIFKILSSQDFVLTPAGSEASDYFRDNLTVLTDISTGKATISGLMPIVTQLRTILIAYQLSFTIGG